MRGLAGIALVTTTACYSPNAAVGVPCGPAGECPLGQHCDTAVLPPTCVAADARPADAPPDAPPTCATNADCKAAAPICDPSTLTCRGCIADTECGNDVCLEYTGACAAENNTLFVTPAGVNAGSCTRTAPCQTIPYALGLVAPNHRTIAVADGTYTQNFQIQSTLGANSLVISGPDRDPVGVLVMIGGTIVNESSTHDIVIEGVTLQSTSPRVVDNRGTLTLSRVAITGMGDCLTSTNPNTLRIWDSQLGPCMQQGINLQQTTLELERSTITAAGNGGITVNNAQATIENCVIADNGTTGSGYGGVRYANLNGKPQVFRFNTVANNLTNGNPSAVQCSEPIALGSSILVDATTAIPLDPACDPSYSLFAVPPTGTGNVMGDPAFVGTGNYHIGASSAARDGGDPAATLGVDIDGEARPQGGTRRDIGADEIP